MSGQLSQRSHISHAGFPSCQPTNSVKALKGWQSILPTVSVWLTMPVQMQIYKDLHARSRAFQQWRYVYYSWRSAKSKSHYACVHTTMMTNLHSKPNNTLCTSKHWSWLLCSRSFPTIITHKLEVFLVTQSTVSKHCRNKKALYKKLCNMLCISKVFEKHYESFMRNAVSNLEINCEI